MRAAFVTNAWPVDPDTRQPTIGGTPFYRQWLPMNCLEGKHLMGRPAWTGATGFGVLDGHGSARFDFDTIALKLLMERPVPHQIRIAQSIGQRVISDVDDLYDDLDDGNLAKEITDPSLSKWANRDHYRAATMQSDTVTVSTPALKEHYEWLGHPDVRLIRNGINPFQLRFHAPEPRPRPVIGWVGGINWRSGDLDGVTDWLPAFLREHGLIFHHSGHVPGQRPLGDLLGLPDDTFTWSPLKPFTHLHTLYPFDIGLVLAADTPFNRAKSALKGLEYAAAGVPFVAQPLPEYLLLEEDGCGVTASTPEEWVDRLTVLLDFDARRKAAEGNFLTMLSKHTITQRADQWRQAFTVV